MAPAKQMHHSSDDLPSESHRPNLIGAAAPLVFPARSAWAWVVSSRLGLAFRRLTPGLPKAVDKDDAGGDQLGRLTSELSDLVCVTSDNRIAVQVVQVGDDRRQQLPVFFRIQQRLPCPRPKLDRLHEPFSPVGSDDLSILGRPEDRFELLR